MSDSQFIQTSQYLNNEIQCVISPAIQLSILNTFELPDIAELLENEEELQKFLNMNVSDFVLHNEFIRISYDTKSGSNISIYDIKDYPSTYFPDKSAKVAYVLTAVAENQLTKRKEKHTIYFDRLLQVIQKSKTEYIQPKKNAKSFSSFKQKIYKSKDLSPRFRQVNKENFTITTPFNNGNGLYTVTVSCNDIEEISKNLDFTTSFFIFDDRNRVIYKQTAPYHLNIFKSDNLLNASHYSYNYIDLVNLFEGRNLSNFLKNELCDNCDNTVKTAHFANIDFQYRITTFKTNGNTYKMLLIGNQKELMQQVDSLLEEVILFTIALSVLLITFSHFFAKGISNKLEDISIYAEYTRKKTKSKIA